MSGERAIEYYGQFFTESNLNEILHNRFEILGSLEIDYMIKDLKIHPKSDGDYLDSAKIMNGEGPRKLITENVVDDIICRYCIVVDLGKHRIEVEDMT